MDLTEQRQVITKEGMSVAYRWRCPFVEVSSKTKENVSVAFEMLIREIRKTRYEDFMKQNTKALSKKSGTIVAKSASEKVYFSCLTLSELNSSTNVHSRQNDNNAYSKRRCYERLETSNRCVERWKSSFVF